MKQACAELTADPGQDAGEKRRYECVPFSPWRYEDYEDVKVSLMSTVLSQLAAAVPEQEEEQEEIGRLRALARKLRRPARRVARRGTGLIPGSVSLLAGMLDPSMDPQMLQLLQQAAQAGAAAAQRLEDSPAPAANAGASAAAEPITEVDDFRDRFTALMETLEDEVAAVVVFIDDLDRRLPETVVDTFEAIRLLLGAPRTAFVLAAHPQIVAVSTTSSLVNASAPRVLSRRANSWTLIICSLIVGLLTVHRNPRFGRWVLRPPCGLGAGSTLRQPSVVSASVSQRWSSFRWSQRDRSHWRLVVLAVTHRDRSPSAS